ncbi:MAG: iron-sulfur cluster assembly accessory protein [Thioalkalispiraceae bacterium]|jgi:iron-sulfur cluster assembly protein
MIKVTPEAAKQITEAAKQGQTEGFALRLAAQRKDDNSIEYMMGFDDAQRDEDIQIDSEGVKLVTSAGYVELLNGLTIDYVEIEPGQYNFIFMNPNDPSYQAPADEENPKEHHL